MATITAPLTWHPPIDLPGDMHLRIAELHGPLDTGDVRASLLDGSLYVLAGYDHARSLHAGYAGMSNAAAPGRAWKSYANWTRAVSSFDVQRLALITADDEIDDDTLRVWECRVIRYLSQYGIYLFNTQVSARESSRRLGDHAEQIANLGDQLAQVVARKVFGRKTNALTTPAHTLRESAIRAILAAERALSTSEVLDRLAAMNVHYSGQTPDHTVRRDLTIRESDTAGALRVAFGYRRGHAVYWPATMNPQAAIDAYDNAHNKQTAPSPTDTARRAEPSL